MVVFFHTCLLSPMHKVTFQSSQFSYGKVSMLASRSIGAQIKDTCLFWGKSLITLSFALKASHGKDVVFSTDLIIVPGRS